MNRDGPGPVARGHRTSVGPMKLVRMRAAVRTPRRAVERSPDPSGVVAAALTPTRCSRRSPGAQRIDRRALRRARNSNQRGGSGKRPLDQHRATREAGVLGVRPYVRVAERSATSRALPATYQAEERNRGGREVQAEQRLPSRPCVSTCPDRQR